MPPNQKAEPSPELSVIIPTLNEATSIGRLIGGLKNQERVHLEIIVADGGSVDDTVTISRKAGCRLVLSSRGRALQMNAGAAVAHAPLFLFLHADSGVNGPLFLRTALDAFYNAGVAAGHQRIAGHFQVRFEGYHRRAMAYRYMEEKSGLNRPETTNGDQGFLLSRNFFQALGRFDATLPFLEDQRLAARVRQEGHWITLPGAIRTSARRFETEGFERRHFMMAVLMGLHYIGLREFFEEAPQVYRAQHEAGKLPVFDLLLLIRGITKRMGQRRRCRAWLAVGRYVKQNAWQVFFLLDVIRRRHRGASGSSTGNRWLEFYDRRVERLLRPKCFDGIAAALTWFWVMGVVRNLYRPFWRGVGTE